jgi:hypothetical protein
MSLITDPIKACEAMLKQTIEGICINEEDQTMTILCNRGKITFDYEAGEAYIDVEAVSD